MADVICRNSLPQTLKKMSETPGRHLNETPHDVTETFCLYTDLNDRIC